MGDEETIDLAVEPPVINDDGELVVECSNQECGRRQHVGTEVDAVTVDELDPGDWAITFTPTRDGRLEVVEVYCHEHRIDKAIDRLAHQTKKMGASMDGALDAAKALQSDN